MMISVVALLACMGVAAASICCVPPQWTARTLFLTTIVHNGKATISKGTTSMAYDAINKRIGQMEEIDINGKVQQRLAVLMDYISNTKYILHDGQCMKTVLNRKPEMFGGCIPDNATLVGSGPATFGFGSNTGDVNTYALDYSGVKAYVGLTSDACVPVSESTHGTLDGNYFLESVNYVNVSAGLGNSDYLRSPPVGCENARLVPVHYTSGGFNTNVIGRRSFLL